MSRRRRAVGGLDWVYVQEVIQKRLPDLASAAPEQTLRMLSRCLDSQIRTDATTTLGPPADDRSMWWRPDIADGQDLHREEIAFQLVTAFRDTSLDLLKSHSISTEHVLSILGEYPWPIFQRLSLFVLSEVETSPVLARTWLMNKDNFENVRIRHEYNLLMKAAFPSLSAPDQQVIIGWANEFDAEETKASLTRWTGNAPTEEELERARVSQSLDRLRHVREHLPSDLKDNLKKWAEEGADLDRPDYAVSTSHWVGPTSPQTTEELAALSVEDLVAYLLSWEAQDGIRGPSPEGLGRQLTEAVKLEPARYATSATRFQSVDPTYVRGVIHGFGEAFRAGTRFPWSGPLALCEWIVLQPRDSVPGRKDREFLSDDPGWGWTRKAIASLLVEALDVDDHGIEPSSAGQVWSILQVLIDDPEPDGAYEMRYGGKNMDPFTLSINTVRPQAIGAMILYARWLWRLQHKPDGEGAELWADQWPMISEVLIARIADPSLAVRAEYGHRFRLFVAFDQALTTRLVPLVFPPESDLRNYWDAAWETYLGSNRLFAVVANMLRSEYKRAIERIGTASSEVRHFCDADDKLAEHLMLLYLWGELDFDKEPLLLNDFFEQGTDNARRHALWYIGKWLSDAPPSEELVTRAQALWNRRLMAAQTSRSKADFREELSAFGGWFASGALPDEWSMDQLLSEVEITRRVQNAYPVMPRLAEKAVLFPEKAARITTFLVEGDEKGWEVLTWTDEIRSIVEVARKSLDPGAKIAGRELANRLVARGYHKFGDLTT